jgi:nicotinamide-nucleotide amidase
MRCEVVAIGTELLLGQIVDTNSSWVGEQLAMFGIDSHFQTKVGDNLDRMEFCIRQALERSDAVICCGGLGPTQDDITRDVIAKIMGVELVRDEDIVDKIRHMFESRGRVMPDNNRRQADIPVGAEPIPHMPGTAPGMHCSIGDKVIYAVPGVPYEMREMMESFILPDLVRRSGETAVIRSRTLRTWGESESGLAEKLGDRIDQLDSIGNPTLAFLASGIEGIKVRITAKSATKEAAGEILAVEEQFLRNLLGDIVFGIDEETMETVVLDQMRRQGMTLAVAESLTGGVMASRLSDIDRQLEVFLGATITAGHDLGTGPERAIAAARKV